MTLPLLVADAQAAIIQLNLILESLRRRNQEAKKGDPLELPDGPKVPLLFDSMPPWAFSGPSPQSSDRLFGSAPGGQTDNAGIAQAVKEQKRAADSTREYYRKMRARDPGKWNEFLSTLSRQARSKDKKLAFYAKTLLAKLRQWGLA